MYKKTYIVFLVIIILSSIGWLTRYNYIKPIASSGLPELYVNGNSVFRNDTNEQVILRGAVSDYFRYGNHNQSIQEQGLVAELDRLSTLKKMGANLIGLYLADSKTLEENKEELDQILSSFKFIENN